MAAAAVSLARPPVPGNAGVFYFVLTDRFANGRTDNDTGGYPGGRNDHGFDPTAISHYHGGDLAGLTQKLDYLKGLGVTAIWLTPPFRNKPVQSGTAGYHGYWILDFLAVDPHLGTEAEFRGFVAAAHARGIRVFMDVILNHTADVIVPEGGDISYRDRAGWPYRDAQGRPFDETRFIDNGVGAPPVFPELSAERSFAHRPTIPPGEEHAKNPAWLNDVRFYHNRGNTDFTGEKSLHGDFVGLDDLFTEHPVVVRGMIDIYRQWIERHGVDGFRIDTAKHTNIELWQAFGPAMREAARRLGKPVVVATQMLESMITTPVPTRAEVSDVATAVFEGADAVMLSAESAAGQYPIEAVATMNRIAEEVERDSIYRTVINAQRSAPEQTGADAIAVAARDVAETLDVKAVCAWTSSGSTALRIARERPGPPILALTPKRETARRLALVWGVHAVVTKDADDVDDMSKRACKFANREGMSKEGERIVIVAGVPFGTPGATNMVRIAFTGNES